VVVLFSVFKLLLVVIPHYLVFNSITLLLVLIMRVALLSSSLRGFSIRVRNKSSYYIGPNALDFKRFGFKSFHVSI